MKTMKKMMFVAMMLIAGYTVNAQTSTTPAPIAASANTPMEDYFIGKWKLNVFGLPSGDAVMLMVIEKKDGKLVGTIGGENGENLDKFTKVEISKNTLLLRFMGGGWDVPMYLDKKDDKSVTGSMNDMFDIEGAKITEEVKK
jgi:hypothetical protein